MVMKYSRDNRRDKLIDQGIEVLADALLDLAGSSDEADDLIERLIASPKENTQRFKEKISDLKRFSCSIDWRGAAGFARELGMLLQDLKAGVEDPLTGTEMAASFFEADSAIFEICDDSNGHIGDIFRFDAKDLFVDYASRCADKDKVVEIILKVNKNDDYGIRNILIDCARECLPEDAIRQMISTLQQRADKENEEHDRRHHLILIESLARQIKDAKLFEQTRIASWGKLSTAAFIDIARVYLESGDVEAAHSWLKKVSEEETFQAYEREKILLEIYERQGDSEKLTEILYRKFKSFHSTDTLQALLDVIGHDRRDEVITAEVTQILKNETLSTSDAGFLIEIGKIKEAEEYLMERAGQLDGNFYGSLIPLAENMESEERHLAASLIYRSLLVSILDRGYTKSYPHGVRYLKKLNKMAKYVDDWKNFNRHVEFKKQIMQNHARKHSFWSKYEEKK
ncbi:hypothetical protein SAMN05920897_103127 [Alkalispirochaeta americana]|uniref:Uncharacterized protein n=1 Tax=Alkalispirochaeta americana TaxID=159291 RepID=A0A1N6PTG2_9SPIO|nr:DUF6880 family protein [Alkalispirochaeta americana]SIQ07557.1 hypothetical protein SAMN05920897_103127 [Alkalispirochaeta americana]